MGKPTIQWLSLQIEHLSANVSEKDAKISELETNVSEKDTKISELETNVSEKDTQITALETSISTKDTQIISLKDSLEKYEVRKFAVAFKDEKDEFKQSLDIWMNLSILSFILLIIITIFIVYYSFNTESIYDKLSFIYIEVITLLFTIFSVKQYIYYTSNYSEALRRQTLAQWYQHILEDWEDDEIKPEYKEKLIDVLCDNKIKENSYKFPQEEILEKVLNIADNVSKSLWK